jgi:hypothetical protein
MDAAGSALEAEDGKLEQERKSMLARMLPLNSVAMRGNVLKKYEQRLLAAQSPRKLPSPRSSQHSSANVSQLRLHDGSWCGPASYTCYITPACHNQTNTFIAVKQITQHSQLGRPSSRSWKPGCTAGDLRFAGRTLFGMLRSSSCMSVQIHTSRRCVDKCKNAKHAATRTPGLAT